MVNVNVLRTCNATILVGDCSGMESRHSINITTLFVISNLSSTSFFIIMKNEIQDGYPDMVGMWGIQNEAIKTIILGRISSMMERKKNE